MEKLKNVTVHSQTVRDDGKVFPGLTQTRMVYKHKSGKYYISWLGNLMGREAVPNQDGSFTVTHRIKSVTKQDPSQIVDPNQGDSEPGEFR